MFQAYTDTKKSWALQKNVSPDSNYCYMLGYLYVKTSGGAVPSSSTHTDGKKTLEDDPFPTWGPGNNFALRQANFNFGLGGYFHGPFWVFPKIGIQTPQNGWFISWKTLLLKWMIFGGTKTTNYFRFNIPFFATTKKTHHQNTADFDSEKS